jgi:hypothetical protein
LIGVEPGERLSPWSLQGGLSKGAGKAIALEPRPDAVPTARLRGLFVQVQPAPVASWPRGRCSALAGHLDPSPAPTRSRQLKPGNGGSPWVG